MDLSESLGNAPTHTELFRIVIPHCKWRSFLASWVVNPFIFRRRNLSFRVLLRRAAVLWNVVQDEVQLNGNHQKFQCSISSLPSSSFTTAALHRSQPPPPWLKLTTMDQTNKQHSHFWAVNRQRTRRRRKTRLHKFCDCKMIHKSPAIRENYQSNHSLPTSSLFRGYSRPTRITTTTTTLSMRCWWIGIGMGYAARTRPWMERWVAVESSIHLACLWSASSSKEIIGW